MPHSQLEWITYFICPFCDDDAPSNNLQFDANQFVDAAIRVYRRDEPSLEYMTDHGCFGANLCQHVLAARIVITAEAAQGDRPWGSGADAVYAVDWVHWWLERHDADQRIRMWLDDIDTPIPGRELYVLEFDEIYRTESGPPVRIVACGQVAALANPNALFHSGIV